MRTIKYRSEIYGICAMWILLYHVSSRIGFTEVFPILPDIVEMGNIGVDIFIVLSGYSCYCSFQKEPNWKLFYVKRLKRILMPYLIVEFLFCLWKATIENAAANGFNVKLFVSDLTMWSFWRHGKTTTWFVGAILVFYIMFPIIYRLICKDKKAIFILLALAYLANILIIVIPSLHHIFGRISIMLTRFPVFLLGVLAAKKYWDFGGVKRSTVIISIVYTILFLVIFPVRKIYLSYIVEVIGERYEGLWLFYSTLAVPLAIVLTKTLKYIPRCLCTGLQKLGNVSLELYLVHIVVLRMFDYYKLWDRFHDVVSYLLAIAISVFFSMILGKIRTGL